MAFPIVHRARGATLSFSLAERGMRATTTETADAWSLEDWFGDGDVFARDALMDAAALLGFDPDHGFRTTTAELLALVSAAVAEGSLRVDRRVEGWPVFRASVEVEEVAPPEEKTEKKTFVAIKLVDDADPSRPVPFKRYRIELPDGSVREGMLDQYGRALVDGIDEGECKVSFPDFDASAWRKA